MFNELWSTKGKFLYHKLFEISKMTGWETKQFKKNCDFRAITSMANSLGRAEGSASVKQPAVMELCKGF